MFAASYMPEKRKVLNVLKHALAALRQQAQEVMRKAEVGTRRLETTSTGGAQ